jgi:hypothetical protein
MFDRATDNYDAGARRRGVAAMLGSDEALTCKLVRGLAQFGPACR